MELAVPEMLELERLVKWTHKKTGIVVMNAVHEPCYNQKVGYPIALGGIRWMEYATEQETEDDVRRLSVGMSRKAFGANLDVGGGKTVVMENPAVKADKRAWREFLLWLAERLNELNSGAPYHYYGGEDVALCTEDMGVMSQKTMFAPGKPEHMGGSGDPSPTTAFGVLAAMYAALRNHPRYRRTRTDLAGITVAIQGLGHVGWPLAQLIHTRGGALIVADVNEDTIRRARTEFQSRLKIVPPDEIHAAAADIFAPCASRGAVINEDTRSDLKANIICGGANNQLATPDDGDWMWEHETLFVPDPLANVGGLVNILFEVEGTHYSRDAANKKAWDIITKNADIVLAQAYNFNQPPHRIFDAIVKERRAERKRAAEKRA